jgi:hypothetical protein
MREDEPPLVKASHRLGEERASVPRIVLPITSRGLVVTDRLCWGVLGVAMALAAGLILYLNRGTTFFLDELAWFQSSPGLGAGDVLDSHGGHLIATTRVAYKAILETFGGDYLVFRLLTVLTLLAAAALFYELVKRRIGALPALAPTLVLLFFGSSWEHVVIPFAFSVVLSIAAGLGALLSLDRSDRRGDLAACALTTLAVVSHTTGLAFLVGVAISVLIRPDRRQRAWIFLIPFALYSAWWLWSLSEPGSAGTQVNFSNVLLIPSYVAESLAVVTAALLGLSYNFADPVLEPPELGWGRVLAVVAIVALALRIRRGHLDRSLWVSLGIVTSLWVLGTLGFGLFRPPTAVRYIYAGAIGVLLVATDAARSIRFSRLGLAVLFGVCAFSLATNLALMRDGASFFRNQYSIPARAQLAALELARPHADPGFDPGVAVPDVAPHNQFRAPAVTYFPAVDRYGSPAFSLSELARQSESARQGGDQVLASALGIRLEPLPSREAAGRCKRLTSEQPGAPISFRMPREGASLRTRSAAPATVAVGRFASSPSAEVGSLSPGQTAMLKLPVDPSPTRWHTSITGASSVEICRLP